MPDTTTAPGNVRSALETARLPTTREGRTARSDDISSDVTVIVPPALTVLRSDDTLVLLQLHIALNVRLHFVRAPLPMFLFAFDHAGCTLEKMDPAMPGLPPARVPACNFQYRTGESVEYTPTWKGSPRSGNVSFRGTPVYHRCGVSKGVHFDDRLSRYFLRQGPAAQEPSGTEHFARPPYPPPREPRRHQEENPQNKRWLGAITRGALVASHCILLVFLLRNGQGGW